MPSLSQRLLPLLQLTRAALVFTAIADSLCALLLYARFKQVNASPDAPLEAILESHRVLALMVISAGLYMFGMSLNDIIDRRRDREIAAHRPLPSGRIGVFAAHVLCAVLVFTAISAGFFYAFTGPGDPMSLLWVIWTAALISFYDFAGKYLVWPGLLTLGLIRFFHAAIAAPNLPLVWQPLLLLNHITLLSTIAYVWEAKRPRLTRLHFRLVLSALAFLDALFVGLVWYRRQSLWITPGLLLPMGAAAAFVLLAWIIRRRCPTRREAGRTLMLYGLLWLIVYDSAFVAGYISWLAAVPLFLLLPISYLSVRVMRWWSNILSLSQRPQFKRANSAGA